MLDTALTVLLVIFFLTAVFFIIPEGLRRLARRNLHRMRDLNRALTALEQSLRETAARLRPFREREADVYRERYTATRAHVAHADEIRQTVRKQLAQLSLAQVRGDFWTFPHFVDHPQHVRDIPQDSYQMWQIERQLQAAHAALAEAAGGLAELDQVPAVLLQDCHKLVEQRLPWLGEALRLESEEGVTALGDLATRLQHAKQRAVALERQLRMTVEQPEAQAAELSLTTINDLARGMEELAAASDALEADVIEMRQEREVLDTRLDAATAARAALPLTAERNTEAAPVVAYTDALLHEAVTLRRERDFNGAAARAGHARILADLAAALAHAQDEVAALVLVAGDSLVADEIEAADDRLQLAIADTHRLLQPAPIVPGANGETADGAGSARLPAIDAEGVASLAERLQQIAARAEQLRGEHEATVQQLEREANRQISHLQRAWQTLQETLSLSADEPLVARYQTVVDERVSVTGKPARLQAFVATATGLTREVKETAAEVHEKLLGLEQRRRTLSQRLAEGEQQAGEWRCLQSSLYTMRECAAAIWQIDPAGETLRAAYSALAESRRLHEQAMEAYETLRSERQRLATLERRIALVRATVENRADDFVPAVLAEALEATEDLDARARHAETVEEAAVALEEAYTLLKEVKAA